MWDFLKVQFDKLLLTFLILALTGVAIYFVHSSGASEASKWAMTTVTGLVGAVTAIITGALLAKKDPNA